MSWQTATKIIPTKRKVDRMDIRLCMENATGTVNMTDVMLQGGVLATLWSGHTSEIRFSFEQ